MEKETQLRGNLTQRIKDKSMKLMGYEINQTELRLLAHLQYQITNSQRINRVHINREENRIINKWAEKGYIERYGGIENKFSITKEFWDIMCELIYLGYVDIGDESE